MSREADVVRQAGRGDADAFAELFRRHSQPAWRLAQAVAPDRDKAVAAFGDGFGRAIRSRKNRDAPFRPQVLASVYRAGLDQGPERIAAPAHSAAATPEEALAGAAFRSLPERWRAAVWLSEVENLDPARIAAVLGVSIPVATQLVSRGLRGLAGRFAQAHQEVPAAIGPVLRSIGVAMPANLAEVASDRLATARAERPTLLAPAGWLDEKGRRPMSVAAASLLALGLIGLAVVPQASEVRGSLGAGGTGNSPGSVPVQTCFGLPCSSGAAAGGPGSATAFTTGFSTGSSNGGGFGPDTPFGAAGVTMPAPPAVAPVVTPPPAPAPAAPAPAAPARSAPTSSAPGGGISVPTTPATSVPSTSVNLAPVASATTGSSGATVNVLPSSSGAAVSATVGSGGASVSVGGHPVLNTKPAPTPTTLPPPVGKAVKGITSTVSTIVGGL